VGTSSAPASLLRPDYGGACLSNVVPTLLSRPPARPPWLPEAAWDAEQVVVLLVDGLGWNQLRERRHLAPTVAAMRGGAISTVVPSTTAAALTSFATGTAPGEHGVVGYRVRTHGQVLNILRWRLGGNDARTTVVPEEFQPVPPFLGGSAVVVSGGPFVGSGFTRAHLRGTDYRPWNQPSGLVVEVARAVRAGTSFVYAYYEGLDKVAHEHGLGEHYDAELQAIDHLVGWLLELLPASCCLLLTADHGQVHVGDDVVPLDAGFEPMVVGASGEARFRWLHARAGAAADLLAAAAEAHPGAWVTDRESFLDEGWMGPTVGRDAVERLGDVAVVSLGLTSYDDPADTGPIPLIGRHGSMTADEMLVPLVAARGDAAP
jgi:hypothetical protein